MAFEISDRIGNIYKWTDRQTDGLVDGADRYIPRFWQGKIMIPTHFYLVIDNKIMSITIFDIKFGQ